MKWLRALIVAPYFVLATLPLAWLGLTSIKSYDDTKVISHHELIRAIGEYPIGRTVVLGFWRTGCPCRKSDPDVTMV